jgi:2-(3-amino-3-carboxypropyl)histidine synthase
LEFEVITNLSKRFDQTPTIMQTDDSPFGQSKSTECKSSCDSTGACSKGATEFKAKADTVRRVIRREKPVDDPLLEQWASVRLPSNYNFELQKLIQRVRTSGAKRVSLQLPEGLFRFAPILADAVQTFAGAQALVMGDVTYGACCVDDFGAALNRSELLIHFAHSCLLPIDQLLDSVRALYVFVDIRFDLWHCVQTLRRNFVDRSIDESIELLQDLKVPSDSQPEVEKKRHTTVELSGDSKAIRRLSLAGSIQFVASLPPLARELRSFGFEVQIAQSKPLSPGEVLGCTAPRLPDSIEAVVFVCDGRFHLEALMIANPQVSAFFRYDPYSKRLSRETYDQQRMLQNRQTAIRTTADLLRRAKAPTIGLLLGTLGHQGSPKLLERLRSRLQKAAPHCRTLMVLAAEVTSDLLTSFGDAVDVWVQISCPRLSIDWAHDVLSRPLLTPFEMSRALDENFRTLDQYPMDFYASFSAGDWTPNHKCGGQCECTA